MRKLVAHTFQRRFADQLGDHDAFRLVGQLTLGVERTARREVLHEQVREQPHLEAVLRRHRHDVGPLPQPGRLDEPFGDGLLRRTVGLGHDGDDRCAPGDGGEL